MASSDDLIVVTGATGQQSTHLIKKLYGKYRLRLVAHSTSSVAKLTAQYNHGDIEIVQAEMCLPPDCARILEGATAVYAMGPPFHPHEKEIGLFMIDAAVAEAAKPASEFRHYIMSSVLNTQLRKMSNHDDKRYVEEYLIESGLDFTIIKPGDFMEQQFFPREWSTMAEPKFLCMLNPDCVSSTTYLDDLSDAAAKVIAERARHYGAIYPIVSNGPTPYRELVEQCSKALGKPIGFEYLTIEKRIETALIYTYGSVEAAPVRVRDKAERLVVFYDRRGIKGSPTVLEWLLGRKPTTMEQYVKKQLA